MGVVDRDQERSLEGRPFEQLLDVAQQTRTVARAVREALLSSPGSSSGSVRQEGR